MNLRKKQNNKKPSDYVAFGISLLNKYLINTWPRRISPFIFRKTKIACNHVSLITHKRDKVLGARLRGELRRDDMFLSEIRVLAEFMEPGVRVLEAGANIGSVAITLAKVEPNSEIFCFEPDALNFSLLNINLELNCIENVHPFNYALGARREYIRMFVSPDNYGDHRSVVHEKIDLGEDKFIVSRTPVLKVNPLDALLEAGFTNVENSFDLMKIDTQGADFEFLRACIPLIKENGKVAIEFSPYHLFANGTSKNEVSDIVSEFSQIQKIVPSENQHYLEKISLNAVEQFYEAQCNSYGGYFDLLLTL